MQVLVFIIFSMILMSACQANNVKPGPSIRGNYCMETISSGSIAKIVSSNKYGIEETKFSCVLRTQDSKSEFLPELASVLKEKSKLAQTKSREATVKRKILDFKADKIISSYLSGKCPVEWKSEIVLDPLGWTCTSKEYPISMACHEGQFSIQKLPSGEETIFCVSPN
jgi:hypothetical protein